MKKLLLTYVKNNLVTIKINIMGENNYTIVQSSYKRRALTFEKIPNYLWKIKTKGFNLFQKTIIAALVSIFAFGFVSLIYLFITKGL